MGSMRMNARKKKIRRAHRAKRKAQEQSIAEAANNDHTRSPSQRQAAQAR
jgi:hypothetical protein